MTAKTEWTAEMDATIRKLRGAGQKWSKISAALRVSETVVLGRWKALNLPKTPRVLTHHAEWTAAQDAAIRRLRSDGETWRAISVEIGCSFLRTLNRGKELGLDEGRVSNHPSKIIWTHAQDSIIRRMVVEGDAWGDIARAVGVGRFTVTRRAAEIGAERVEPEPAEPQLVEREVRQGAPVEALPAGHPYTWGLLTKGTSLEGSEYVHALNFRQFAVRCNDFVAHANAIGREVPAAPPV
jgi:hypothetical protein